MTGHPRISANLGARCLRKYAAELRDKRSEASRAAENAVIMLTPESAAHLNQVLDLAADTLEVVARFRWPEEVQE